jgi:hypothetical protein
MAVVKRCKGAQFYIVRWDDGAALIEEYEGRDGAVVLQCYWCDRFNDCPHVGLVFDFIRAAQNQTGEQRLD